MPDIYFHNTLSGAKERFEPIDPNRVTVYVCGPTVYNYVHIGNGRPASSQTKKSELPTTVWNWRGRPRREP